MTKKRKREDYRKPKTRENVLEEEEIEKLLAAVKTKLEEFIVKVLLYTGLRVSELIHLRRDWVDFKHEKISVPERQPCGCETCERVLRNKKGKITKPSGFWQPKTPEGAGTIPMVPEVKPILKWFLNQHEEVMNVFPYRQYINNTLKKVVKRVKLGHPVFPHALRGTFATILADKDFDVFEIKDALRWKTIQPAIFYVKLSGERLKRVFGEKW